MPWRSHEPCGVVLQGVIAAVYPDDRLILLKVIFDYTRGKAIASMRLKIKKISFLDLGKGITASSR